MNRGFKYYFGRGMRTAVGTLLKGGKYFRYYAYFFAALLGRAVPIAGCLIPVADVRRAKTARDERELTVARSFGGVETGCSVGTAILVSLIKGLVTAGGAIACIALGALLFFAGTLLGTAVGMANARLLGIILAIPAALAAAAYVICVLLMYAPTAYMIDSFKNSHATGVLTAASETMRRGGKTTLFLNTAVPLLIKAVYLAAVGGVYYVLTLISAPVASVLLIVLWLIISLGVYVVFAPVFTITGAVANVCLFDDIALDPESMNNRTKGLFITRCSTSGSLADKGRDASIESLFDSAEESAEPPDTRYVPPTDYAEKMHVFKPEDEAETEDREDTAADVNADRPAEENPSEQDTEEAER